MVVFVQYLSVSIALLTAWAFQKRSQPQQLTLCWSLHAEALQATASEGLAQGRYVAARAGFEPATPGRKALTLPMRHHTPQVEFSVFDLICWHTIRLLY